MRGSVSLDDEHHIRQYGSTFSSSSSFTSIITSNTPLHTRKTIKYFTTLAIINVAMSLGWLAVVIWIGVMFTRDANYDPEFLLTYLPVFMLMVVGLDVECIPLVIIIRSLRSSHHVPSPSIQVCNHPYIPLILLSPQHQTTYLHHLSYPHFFHASLTSSHPHSPLSRLSISSWLFQYSTSVLLLLSLRLSSHA